MATGTLVSPGVSVTVTDMTNYVSSGPGTVPFIVLATASNKASTSGGIAPYTTSDTAGQVQLITSQRELLQSYGIPTFPVDASGNRIFGSEIAEYGLHAAHSVLGVSSMAYILRADVDLAELEGKPDRPYGTPQDQTVYQNTNITEYGIYEWDSVVQDFIIVKPNVITNREAPTALYVGSTRPLPNYGKIGDYAVVATDIKNPVYVKALDNHWYQVGTDAWKTAIPTVQGNNTLSDSAVVAGSSIRINGVQITVQAGNTAQDVINAINAAAIVGVSAALHNRRVCLFASDAAESGATIDPLTGLVVPDGRILLQNVSGLLWANAGISVADVTGTLYNSPEFAAQPHYAIPAWSIGETGTPCSAFAQLGIGSPTNVDKIVITTSGSGYTVAPTVTIGMPWQSGETVNLNDDIIFNGYHYTVIAAGNLGGGAPTPVAGNQINGSAILQFAGIAATAEAVLTNHRVTEIVVTNQGTGYTTIPAVEVSVPGGDTSRPTGSVWLKTTPVNKGAKFEVSVYDSYSGAFVHRNAPVYLHNDAEATFGLDKLLGGLGIPAGTLYVCANFGPAGTDLLNYRIMQRQVSGPTVVTGLVLNPGFNVGDQFEISVTTPGTPEYSKKYTITMVTPQGVTPAAMFVSQLMSANIPYIESSVNDIGQISITHLSGGVIRMRDIGGTALTDAGFTTNVLNIFNSDEVAGEIIGSNWSPANLLFQQYTEPLVAPADGTMWYYDAPLLADIMINDGARWRGYQNIRKDTRGFDLRFTDPNGVIFSTIPPTAQTTGSPLAYGDLWCDTSNMELYPNLKRWSNILGVDQWVQIDNTDHVTTNGILFADARWDNNGTTDPAIGDYPVIQSLMLSDYVDLDAPDPTLYPRGCLLFNTRRSSRNVKKFAHNYFNNENFPNRTLPVQTSSWISVSGIKSDGTPYFGRTAQRDVIVSAMQKAVDININIREDQRFFNLLCCPGYPELSSNLVQLNNDRRNTGFILADTPMRLSQNSTELLNYLINNAETANDDEAGLTITDPYLAYFYPSCGLTNAIDSNSGQIVVPMTHAILRMVVRSDQQSYQWFAPAGSTRGLIDNIISVGYLDKASNAFKKVGTTQGLRDLLYEHNVNPVAIFPGVGIMNYGQKTRQMDMKAMDRINVARLVNYIRYQLEIIVKPLIFEPNDKITRDEAKAIVENLMSSLVTKRGLYDFLVVCDETNNTPASIDRNELYIDVAIEPVKAVEFIYIPVRILNTGSIKGTGHHTGGISNTSSALTV